MNTIQQGSQGPDVATWQKVIGVPADGIFGAQTDSATRKWQGDHGLTADGIVGPLTWAAAQSISPASSSSMSSKLSSPWAIAGIVFAAGFVFWAFRKD